MHPYDLSQVQRFRNVDHNESLAIGPKGEAYTVSFYNESVTTTDGHTHTTSAHPFRAFRLNLETNLGEAFATLPYLCLGQVVDADGNLYCAECESPHSRVIRVTPEGAIATYATGPNGGKFQSANTPVFDRRGFMLISDTGSWSETIDGRIYRIPPGGGQAEFWYPGVINTPNGIALDPEETFLYYVETLGNSIARIAINKDGSAGRQEPVVHMPMHVPDGIAFDEEGRIWIACHRPDAIYVFDPRTRRLDLFAHDWQGEALRGPCHVAFAGENRDILLASSLDKATVSRFNQPGTRGHRLNYPKLS